MAPTKVVTTAHIRRGVRLVEASFALASVAAILALGATSAYGRPSAVGTIAFERVVGTNSDVYTVAPDGSSVRRLTSAPGSDFAPSWSSGGRIVFASDRMGSFELFTMTARGAAERRLTRSGPPANKSNPDWAPDASRIAFTAGSARRADIYVLTIGSSRLVNATRNISSDDASPSWSPDGREFVFSSTRGGRHLYRYLVESRQTVALTRGSGLDSDPAWSPDGRRIAFTRRDANGNYDVWVIDLASGDERRLTSGTAQDRAPTWSPDGTAIAFVTNRDSAEDYEIYVMGSDGSRPVNITRSPRTIDLAPDWSSASVRPAGLTPASRTPQIAAATCDAPVGTDRGDNLVGNDSAQVLCGKGGNDTIHAAGGDDRVQGGPGNDAIWGQLGRDAIQGGAGKDKLYGGRGADTFYPGGGKDGIDGGPGTLDRCAICDLGDVVVRVELVT